MKRHRMSNRSSRRSFRRTAGHNHVHPKNALHSGAFMRGGIRL